MKQKLIIAIVLVLATSVQAQNSNFSTTLSYPLPLADDTFSEYTGIADLGLQYGFYKSGNWQLGASLNGSYYTRSRTSNNPTFTLDENILLLQPKAFATVQIGQGQEFMPFFGLGYSLAIYSLSYSVANAPPDENEAKGGVNLSAGATVELSKRLFAIVQYDNISFGNTDGGLNLTFSDSFGIAKLGLGYQL